MADDALTEDAGRAPWTPPEGLDPEVLEICEAINALPGVATVESCCGHRERPFRVWLHVADPEDLLPLLWAVDQCHSGRAGWGVRVYTDCAASVVTWQLEGPVGAYEAAAAIAALLRDQAEALASETETDRAVDRG